ncbi:phosphoadenosine phosphosulfate reductase family protein [Moryella indoligenes]|nr:phosphoadenosine phosphosulfate reductase family protein [Moryella indoligenes]
MADLLGIDRRINKENPDYQALLMGTIPSKPKGDSRYRQVIGTYQNKDGSTSKYCLTKYQFFLDAPFEISAKCCNAMKKAPVHAFGRKTGRKPMTAQMASESRLRTAQWLKNGCNGFHMTSPISNPMSFWTEQDVLLYIKEHNLPICSVYGEIIEVEGKSAPVKDADMMELFDLDKPFLKTTGCDRTGCMFCGYGCHLEKPGEGRFLRMKETHPKQYDYIMRSTDKGGLNYKEVIDWINENGGFHIEY